MHIGTRSLGSQSQPLIIAEIGINHGGNLDKAKKMVKLAYENGCECVKHQTHFVEDEMTEEARKVFPPNAEKSIWEIMENCSLSKDEEIQLKNYTEDLGLIYLSTPFSRAAAYFLNDIGVQAFKIGSGECDNLPLVELIASFGKPIIMSTGMHKVSDIFKSVNILRNFGLQFALLQCTNLYPSPPETVSLLGIIELQENFKDAIIGFSDHSIGPEMSLAAVALGAKIVERHFTISQYEEGPDILCSMTPLELNYLIVKSYDIFKALQNKKMRTKKEEQVYKFARSSVVADRELEAGTIIKKSDIWTKRPGTGEIAGYDYELVLGKKTKISINKNQQLKWEMFE